ALPLKGRPQPPARSRARGWRPVQRSAASGRKEKIAATFRIWDSGAAGSGPTTSSLRCLLRLLAQARTRTRRQSQDADEPGRVLLVIAFAHGERRKVGAIERKLRLAAGYVNIALVELERDLARDFLLCLGDEGVE